MRELLGGEKLQIHVEEWRSIEADEESRFADVEGGQQRTEALRDFGSRPQHVVRSLGTRDADEVEIGVFVQLAGDERAPAASPARRASAWNIGRSRRRAGAAVRG